eukprot:CAMPEP_0196573652 /NCGR_PEP_ID=MMETSP1081-20130531/3514_1 /TAXON_ID=36882 /ORGANISM="Pyramimonas amylifera, Strain CCMP720" /LENGTH=539 /DNA_ID=CAMNT_0041891433 /DNA_START=50 /DNA_END=1666 /DNA_ORIENTATION=+
MSWSKKIVVDNIQSSDSEDNFVKSHELPCLLSHAIKIRFPKSQSTSHISLEPSPPSPFKLSDRLDRSSSPNVRSSSLPSLNQSPRSIFASIKPEDITQRAPSNQTNQSSKIVKANFTLGHSLSALNPSSPLYTQRNLRHSKVAELNNTLYYSSSLDPKVKIPQRIRDDSIQMKPSGESSFKQKASNLINASTSTHLQHLIGDSPLSSMRNIADKKKLQLPSIPSEKPIQQDLLIPDEMKPTLHGPQSRASSSIMNFKQNMSSNSNSATSVSKDAVYKNMFQKSMSKRASLPSKDEEDSHDSRPKLEPLGLLRRTMSNTNSLASAKVKTDVKAPEIEKSASDKRKEYNFKVRESRYNIKGHVQIERGRMVPLKDLVNLKSYFDEVSSEGNGTVTAEEIAMHRLQRLDEHDQELMPVFSSLGQGVSFAEVVEKSFPEFSKQDVQLCLQSLEKLEPVEVPVITNPHFQTREGQESVWSELEEAHKYWPLYAEPEEVLFFNGFQRFLETMDEKGLTMDEDLALYNTLKNPVSKRIHKKDFSLW